ncbi:MAG: ParA family protein [Candidatus Sungbacteria bacterium]|uniref:ParA family protein n=1 Tax=Candidatus Sungiibacteriota bacterium TaxID=2750080 RepID=A0A932YY09_9BACT|nr:ParA family protein [Candidatus Sungbacteria bacterium]
MAATIVFCNNKGGVGKTTTSINVSAYLVALGKKVLLVDIDPQANATSGLGLNPNGQARHLYHGLIHELHPNELIRPTPLLNLHILPSGADLAGAMVDLVRAKNREYRLRDLLRHVNRRYDYILVDPPPSLDLLTVNALTAADRVVIPVQCEYYALEGLAKLLSTIDLINHNLKTKITLMGALLTMFDKTSRLHRAVAREVRRKFPGYVFDTVIPRNVSLAEAPSFGKSILQYDPYSHGAKAYRALAQEIIHLGKD